MKIKPKKIIVPGSGIKTAEHLVVVSESDNLVDSVSFRATLKDADLTELVSAHVNLDASNYGTWDATVEGAHRICADALELKLA